MYANNDPCVSSQQVPVGLPPGMDPEQAKLVVEFMKKNPEFAMQTVQQMEQLMKNPAKAQSLIRMQVFLKIKLKECAIYPAYMVFVTYPSISPPSSDTECGDFQ